jgi:hypothetical protein
MLLIHFINLLSINEPIAIEGIKTTTFNFNRRSAGVSNKSEEKEAQYLKL